MAHFDPSNCAVGASAVRRAHRSDEARAFASYERLAMRRFTSSFLAGAAFRRLLHTPLFDAAVKLGSRPRMQQATARMLANL
jgi:hypothetical protein